MLGASEPRSYRKSIRSSSVQAYPGALLGQDPHLVYRISFWICYDYWRRQFWVLTVVIAWGWAEWLPLQSSPHLIRLQCCLVSTAKSLLNLNAFNCLSVLASCLGLAIICFITGLVVALMCIIIFAQLMLLVPHHHYVHAALWFPPKFKISNFQKLFFFVFFPWLYFHVWF